MTTNVLILANSWPVRVVNVDHDEGGLCKESEACTVEPGKHGTAYITNTRSLRIEELPPPPVTLGAPPEFEGIVKNDPPSF